MGIFDKFRSSDRKQDLDEQYINGEISHAEYERKLDRQIEATVTKEEKLQQKRESRQLAGSTPQTFIDSGGSGSNYTADEQELGRDELRKLKRLREDGGIISQLVHARALLTFGTGCEFESEDDEVAEWLNDQFDNLDDLLIRLGEDSYWFARGFGETVETNGGNFGRIVGVEPWTMQPEVDRHGQVTSWEQEIQDKTTQSFDPEEIGVIILEKSSARDETGISVVLRAYDEIKAFKENQQSINRAIELAGFPHIHWKVGAENQMAVNDQELRRVRNIVQSMESDTQLVTGTDVEHNRIDPTTFDFTEISQHDIRRVATALGVPLELASVISEGLGSGEQSGLRQRMFKMQVRADRRTMSDQFIEQFINPILEQYSPFNPENVDRLTINFDPLFEDKDEKQQQINAIGEDMTVNERRALFDKEPIGDDVEDVDGDGFEPASDQQAPEDEGGDSPLPFLSAKDMSSVPDSATPIDSPADAPEGTEIVEGPRGGTYAVPSEDADEIGEDASDGDEIPDDVVVEDEEALRDVYESANIDAPLSDVAEETAQIEETFSGMLDTEGAAMMAINNLVGDADYGEGADDSNDDYTPPENPEMEDELEEFDDGDEITVDTERAGEVSGNIVDTEFIEYGDVIIEDEDGNEHVIPVDEIDGVTSGIEASGPFDLAYAGDSGNWYPTDGVESWELAMYEQWDRCIATDEQDRELLGFSETETPEFVKDRIRDSIMAGNIFSDFETVASGELMQLREYMTESLTDDGWTIDGVADQLMQLDGVENRNQAEVIARTETASVLNSAREDGYREKGQDDSKFYWQNPLDQRSTEACEWLTERTNPFHGGEPVSLDELKELIEEAPRHDEEMQDDLARPDDFVIHPNERSTWVRMPGT